jgi:hypothetical protein
MKYFKPLAWATLGIVALGLFAAPSAQAGTRVSVNIGGFGGGYCQPAYYPRPVAYCPPPRYVQPYYRPVYYPGPRAYCPPPGYRAYPAHYGYSPRPAYFYPGYR